MTFANKFNLRFINISIIVLLLTTVGCSHVSQLPSDKSTLSTINEKIDLNVKLIIPSDIRNANYSTSIGSDTYTVQIGEYLENYSKQLVVNVFTHPINTDNKLKSDRGEIYILTPHVKFINYVRGGSGWDEKRMTIGIEWTLTNYKGNIKWIGNVIGKGIGVSYSGHQDSITEFLSLAIKDVFEQSQNAMVSSKVMRKL